MKHDFLCSFLYTSYVLVLAIYHAGANNRIGHLEKFGTGPSVVIDETAGFIDAKSFFETYAWQSKPLIMRGAIADSVAVQHWSDDYFLSLSVPDGYEVLVETKKKEDRKQNTLMLHFHEFVRTYNTTERYMVQTVPPFLRGDLPLPFPLQCEQVYADQISDALMWYSSGGTKSVVHTDSVENINCLVRGEKEFVMVDPHKYGDRVDIDHPDGAYSSMDVDRVDYDKYPGMDGVEFYHIKVTAGDCLYIPYKWIHQVRSYHRNIAVNLWWSHYGTQDLDLSLCSHPPDPEFTLDRIVLNSQDSKSAGDVRDFLQSMLQKGPVDFEQLHDVIIGDLPVAEMDAGGGYREPLMKIMAILDQDGDGFLRMEELDEVQPEDWDSILEHMEWFEDILDALESKWAELDPDFDPESALPGDGEFYFDDDPNEHDEL